MIAPEVRKAVLTHLHNPLRPLKKSALGPAAEWVTFPTQNHTQRGGLTLVGLHQLQGEKEILDAAKTHMEQTRVNLHSVIATCSAFVRANKKGERDEQAIALLKKGITVRDENGELDQIQTSLKNGQLLTPRFMKMMDAAYAAVKNSPTLSAAIVAAATIQKAQEKSAAKKQEGIAQMA
jgi:hypothetical protein